MRTLHIPFGTYVDARPDGRFACLVVDDGPGMQLDTERLTIPRDARPLYVRVPREGPFKFAGQSSNSPETIEWIEGTGWVPRPIVPCGVSPVIYDLAGTLHISDCGPAVGSQGYRYVDVETGALVTGDQTLGSDFGLAEWTYLGDGLYVGQCNVTPGCALWDGHDLRMVEPGDCFFIRGQRVGNDVSLAMVRHAGEPAVIVWATMDELRALPVIDQSPTVVYPAIAPFAHAVSIAPFKDPDGTSEADSEVVIDGARQAVPRPCWVGFDLDGGTTAIDRAAEDETLVGVYAQDHGDRGVEHARIVADRLGCRIAWLQDSPEPPVVPRELKAWDQVWVEEYLVAGETLADARARWTRAEAAALASPCHDLGLVPMYYGDFGDQATVDAIASSLTTINTNARWKVIAPFQYERVNGITGRPPIAEMYGRTLDASVLGEPAWTPMPDPPVPPEPPDPPIDPPIPPDPPIVPPSEVPMPIPPVTSWPFVHQAGKSPVSLTVTAPFAVPHPTSGYEDFQTAIRAVKPDGDYVQGFLGGWAMLSGGAAPDVAAGKALSILHDGAMNKDKNNYGQGYTDVWRLLVEKGCDVDATLAAQ
jgi:hypothetical protein